MVQTPEPDLSEQPHTPTVSDSVVPFLVSTVRSFALGASFLYRAGEKVDDEIGRIVEARSLKTESRSQSLSLIGSGAILISAFAPILNIPVVGPVTYFNGNSEFALLIGVLLVVLGLVSLSLALIEKYAWLYATGFCALLIAFGTLVSLKWYLARATSAASTPASGVFGYFTQSASRGLAGRSSLSFGFPLLVYGAALVILAALMRPRRSTVNAESPPS